MTVFQLDLSLAVKLPCLGDDTDWLEQTYVALVVLLVLVYVAALLLLPRLRLVQTALLYTPTKAHPQSTCSALYAQFTYRVGVVLILTHAISCKLTLSSISSCGGSVTGNANDKKIGGSECNNARFCC